MLPRKKPQMIPLPKMLYPKQWMLLPEKCRFHFRRCFRSLLPGSW